jgi:hypothetical protein
VNSLLADWRISEIENWESKTQVTLAERRRMYHTAGLVVTHLERDVREEFKRELQIEIGERKMQNEKISRRGNGVGVIG